MKPVYIDKREEMMVPAGLAAYNKYMRGVDLFDHLRGGSYDIARTLVTRKWHVRLLLGMFGFATTQTWIFYQAHFPSQAAYHWYAFKHHTISCTLL